MHRNPHTQSIIDPVSLEKKGNQAFKEKKFAEAIEYYNQILIDSRNYSIATQRAKAFFQLGQYQELLSTSLNTFTEHSDAQEIDLWFAQAYYHLKQYGEALEFYQKVLDWPDCLNTEALLTACEGLGDTFAALEKKAEALNVYLLSVNLNPFDANIYYKRGCIHASEKQFKEALADLHQSLELDPTKTNIHLEIGKIHHETQQYALAMHQYALYLKHHPHDQDAITKLENLCEQEKNHLLHLIASLPRTQEIELLQIALNTGSALSKKLSDKKIEIQERLNLLLEPQPTKEIAIHFPKIQNQILDPSLENHIKEAIFHAMSAYRLKFIEWQFLKKQFSNLAAQIYRLEKRKNTIYENKDETQKIPGMKDNLKNFPLIKTKNELNHFLHLLTVLSRLKNNGFIWQADLEDLKKFTLFKFLTDHLDTLNSSLKKLSDQNAELASIAQLEKDFIMDSKEKIQGCKNRYELLHTIKAIGWLRENIHENQYDYDNKIYRGDLFDKISFKKIRENKSTLRTYTSQFGIHEKIKLICEEHEKNQQDELLEDKKHVKELYQAYLLAQQSFLNSKKELKEKKIKQGDLPEKIQHFRKQQ